ncbi:MAG: dockerin type I domain-containing protein, partial [Chloroflexota bacterium]
RIRKVDAASGNITTVAGNGVATFSGDGGSATAASLHYPTGVKVDGAGNLYIADMYNNRIRKVDAASGNITTVAGNGAFGFSGDGGAATAASLNQPWGVTVDSAGNLYIADYSNNRIRKVMGVGETVTVPPAVTITSPAQDAIILTSPVTVTANASDDVGVTALTINNVAATLISGTPAAGIWQASVPVSLPVPPGGALIFTAIATDAAGNSGTASVTVDNDGISAIIDTNPNAFSDNFTDIPLGGTTFGSIATRAGWTVRVIELANPAGVQVSIYGTGSNSGARVVTDDTGDSLVETILQFAGETANITCIPTGGTPPPTTQVSAVFASPGKIKVKKPPTGTPGPAVVVLLSTGQTATIGSVTASPNNTEPIDVQLVDGQDNRLGSGLLPPGASIDIEFLPGGIFLFRNLSSTATITFTINGITFTLTPGQSFQTIPLAVTTGNSTNITVTSARLSGSLTSLGAALSANVSFQWGLSSGNYTFETTPVAMTATGPLSANITGLSANTTYYFRAKAVGDGTSYGAERSFTTSLVVVVLPGDANGDGVVNALDITKIERIIIGLDAPTPGADANQDGNINAIDITKTERLIAGLN